MQGGRQGFEQGLSSGHDIGFWRVETIVVHVRSKADGSRSASVVRQPLQCSLMLALRNSFILVKMPPRKVLQTSFKAHGQIRHSLLSIMMIGITQSSNQILDERSAASHSLSNLLSEATTIHLTSFSFSQTTHPVSSMRHKG